MSGILSCRMLPDHPFHDHLFHDHPFHDHSFHDHPFHDHPFLTTTKAALEMRQDLKQWSEALKLAEMYDPDSIPSICKEHAAQLEMMADYNNARIHYQQVCS